LQMTRALDRILAAAAALEDAIAKRAVEFRDTAMVGRTHGIHAEPTTFGAKLALWALQADRDRRRLCTARDTIAVGKLSGAVGTYSNIDPAVEAPAELMGTEIRHLQRTEVGEVLGPFRAGQKGSSAMPHKRNPIKAEQMSGLARVLRGYLGAGLEDVALWHERDISHSSVERVILPDASILAHYLLVRGKGLIEGLTVDTARMLDNL